MHNKRKEIIINILIVLVIFGITFEIMFCATSASLRNDAINICKDKMYFEQANPGSISTDSKVSCAAIGIEI